MRQALLALATLIPATCPHERPSGRATCNCTSLSVRGELLLLAATPAVVVLLDAKRLVVPRVVSDPSLCGPLGGPVRLRSMCITHLTHCC